MLSELQYKPLCSKAVQIVQNVVPNEKATEVVNLLTLLNGLSSVD